VDLLQLSRLPLYIVAAAAALALALALLPASYRQAVTLGVVQGLGEFLPISSSAHLILTPWFFGWPDPGLTFDVALHVGTLLAVVLYFWRDWMRLLVAAPRPRSADGRMFWMLILGSIPGGIAGVLLDDMAEQGLITIHDTRVNTEGRPAVALMERVLHGLRRL